LKAATIRDRLRDVSDINASSGNAANRGHLATVARMEYLVGFGEIAVRECILMSLILTQRG